MDQQPRIEFLSTTGRVLPTAARACAFRLPEHALEFALKPQQARNHDHALALASGCTLLGHGDWRLPTRRELELLIDLGSHHPATWAPLAKHTPTTDWYWSSTPLASDPGCAWDVYFAYGSVNAYDRDLSGFVRAVRSVPPSQ